MINACWGALWFFRDGWGGGTCIPKETYTFVIFQGKKWDPDPHPTLDPGTTLLNPLLLMDWFENLVC